MKKILRYFIVACALSPCLISCRTDSESSTGFQIRFSNNIIINQNDIIFYDSSECLFLLRDTIKFKYSVGNPSNLEFVKFSITIDNNLIYQGIVFPEGVSLGSPNRTYIASYTDNDFKSNLLHVIYQNFWRDSLSSDPRNDDRLISFFEERNKLRKGITIALKSIRLSTIKTSSIINTITMTNNDNIDYYLPDPNKIGSDHFNYLTGGLDLTDKITYFNYAPYHDYPNSTYNWNKLKIEDLSILKSKNEVTFTYESLYPNNISKGYYDCKFQFGVLRDFTIITVPLKQEDGWIWVGNKIIRIDNILIE
jgi:hypothetical protein